MKVTLYGLNKIVTSLNKAVSKILPPDKYEIYRERIKELFDWVLEESDVITWEGKK